MWQKRLDLVVAGLAAMLVIGVAFPWIHATRAAARKMQSKNNLRQIGLAIFNYSDTTGRIPTGGTFNEDQRGFHGWMTAILPYATDSPFYNEVNFHEAWDSKVNAGLFLNKMEFYESPDEPNLQKYWEFPVAHYCANAHLMAVNSFIRHSSIEDTSNVFMVGELDGQFVPWGCPYNWRVLDGINQPEPTFGRSTRDGCLLLFADGRVGFVANEISKELLTKMNGDDLTGYETNEFKIQIPAAFPCPADAIWLSWSYGDGGRFEIKKDVHGTIKSKVLHNGK